MAGELLEEKKYPYPFFSYLGIKIPLFCLVFRCGYSTTTNFSFKKNYNVFIIIREKEYAPKLFKNI